jgi:hypothetical protein
MTSVDLKRIIAIDNDCFEKYKLNPKRANVVKDAAESCKRTLYVLYRLNSESKGAWLGDDSCDVSLSSFIAVTENNLCELIVAVGKLDGVTLSTDDMDTVYLAVVSKLRP